jgi:DNA polymerase III delta subunit
MATARGAHHKITALCRKIQSMSAVPRFVFFVAEQNDDLMELLANLREKLIADFGNCDEVHLSGYDNDAATWHAEMMTMPMFPSGRLILIRHAEALLKRIEGQPRVLANYLRDFPQAPEFTVSVLQFGEKKIPKKLKPLEELALIYEDEPLSAEELTDHLATRAQALGFVAERQALELLVDKCAGIEKLVYAAFDRLITYRLHEKKISTADVEEAIDTAESNLHFRLLDETARRNIGECLRILQLHALDSAEQLIAALARLFSEALRHHYYEHSGMSAADIGQVITQRPLSGYALKKSIERWSVLCRKYSPAEISVVLDALVKADTLIKQNPDTGQQQIILTSFYLMLSKAL